LRLWGQAFSLPPGFCPALLFCATALAAPAGIVSRDWKDATLTLKLDDGAAEIEWISPTSFRYTRTWGPQADRLPKIAHDPVKVDFEDRPSGLFMRTRYMNLDLDRASLTLRAKSSDTLIAEIDLARQGDGARLHLSPMEKVLGRLPFFIVRSGYGVNVRGCGKCTLDAARGAISAPNTQSLEFVFYYGPAPKEILDQHQTVTGPSGIPATAVIVLTPNRVPASATALNAPRIDSWDALTDLVHRLIQGSYEAVLYPALDLSALDPAQGEIKQRAADLFAWLPVVYRSGGGLQIDRALREQWRPYWITYYREAFDRGYPLIRPLAIQFWRDANSDRQNDVFMLGDELLLAPVLAPGSKRKLELPMGIWTDLRTNREYKGRQAIEVDAPPGAVPMFSRNGALFPLAKEAAMELHYFPSLGGEFFLWEPDVNENSQFHASPAAEDYRLEIETRVKRTYEWIIHHMGAASVIAEGDHRFERVKDRASLRPGAWWHDDALNNLHVMLEAGAKTDRIVNVSF
jgi:hypothetical protein